MSTAGRFRDVVKLGEGTYGSVYRARELDSGCLVAFKRMVITSEDEGIPGTAVREICLLKEMRHENIVLLYDVLFDSPKFTLIFELCDCDMKQYMDKYCESRRLNAETEVRPVLRQMFAGLNYLHSRSVIHRDLKPQNVFFNIRPTKNLHLDAVWGASRAAEVAAIAAARAASPTQPAPCAPSGTGTGSDPGPSPPATADAKELLVKLGDFGLARVGNIPVKKYSHEVVTLWYRSPDVLMGSAIYSFPVDVWSMGTIFFEMVTGRVLFGGGNEDDQMLRMLRLLGSPTKDTWPSMRSCPGTNDRLERVSAFVTRQRHEHRANKERVAATEAAAAAAAEAAGSRRRASATNTSNLSKEETLRLMRQQFQNNGPFSFTAYCLEHEDVETLRNSANSGRSAVNSLRLPVELWFPRPLFDDYMELSGFHRAVGDDGVDLLWQCLQYEPAHRITTANALKHPFIRNVRTPTTVALDAIMSRLDQSLRRAGGK